MAGMAANVSSLQHGLHLRHLAGRTSGGTGPTPTTCGSGRIVTVVGVLIGIGTAFIAAGYSNIMNYIQLLFSIFNAPLFATFIIGMFWKRMPPVGAASGGWSPAPSAR